MALSRSANILISPLVEMFYPLPKSALIPITVIWLGFGDASKILLIFLGCMLPVTIGAYNGARSTRAVAAVVGEQHGRGQLRMMRDVVVPSALPELLNGIRTALALSFILLVTSELIASRKGFGYLIGLIRLRWHLRRDVRYGSDRGVPRLFRGPRLSDGDAEGDVMAGIAGCRCSIRPAPGRPRLPGRFTM